jgi:hypothetical protein
VPENPNERFGRVGGPLLAVAALVVLALSAALVSLAPSSASGRLATTSTTRAVSPTTTAKPAPATTLTPPTSELSPSTTTTDNLQASYDSQVDAICQQYVPSLTQIASTGIDGLIFHQAQVKSLVSTMLSDISSIPAPNGQGPVVTSWIVDWEQAWDAAFSANTKLFTSDIQTADSAAKKLGYGPECS